MSRASRALAVAAGLTLSAATPAHAHTYLPQAGAFTNGLIHPFLVAEMVTALIALGVWLGQQDQAKFSAGFAAFLLAALAGFVLAAMFPTPDAGSLVLAVGAFLCGGLTALGRTQPRLVTVGLCLFIGAGFGVATHDPFQPLGMAVIGGLGSAAGGVFLLLNLIALGAYLRRDWMRIGFRVIGSWTAAIALLVLAMRFLR